MSDFCMSDDDHSGSCQLVFRYESLHEGDTVSLCVCPLIGWHQFDMSYYWHIWGTGSSGAVPRHCQEIIVNTSLSQNSDPTA